MPSRSWLAAIAALALPLPGYSHSEDPADVSRRLSARLRCHEAHGLLGPSTSLEDMLRTGQRLFWDEQFSAAAVIFRTAVNYFPSSPAARFAFGQALFARGDYHEGARHIKQGLEMDPYWAKIDYSVYGLYSYPGDLDRQVRLLKDYLRDRADDRDALFILGFLQYHLTRNDQARACFLRLAGMSPDDDLVRHYARLLDEKEKMRLGKRPYGVEVAKAPSTPKRKPKSAGKKAKPGASAPAIAPAPAAPSKAEDDPLGLEAAPAVPEPPPPAPSDK